MPIIRIRGEDGKFHPVPSTVGPPGKDGSPGKDGAPGADGGYYKPSVSESGDLTWTSSKEGMPAVSVANIKGPQGNAGADGADGKTAYQAAKEGGYTGTEAEFNAALGGMKNAPFLPLSGGTITGNLQVNSITGIDGGEFDTGGINVTGSFTTDGDVTFDLKGCVINGVNDPVKETDAANKRYVDGKAGYTKVETWKSATAALFGLGADSVPDEAFAYVGKYAQYWWRRRLLNAGTEYITPYIEGSPSSEDPAKYILYVYDSDAPGSITYPIQYSDGVTVGDDGKPTGLADPIKTVNLSYDNCLTEGNVLKGKFIVQRHEDKRFPSQSADKGIAFVPSTAVFDRVTKYGTESYVYTDYISIDITANPKKGEWEYLQSNDDDAYPHSGESGGYEYEYLGIPFENAASPHVRIATGSYVGTGKFTSSNPNSLTFDAPPKLVFIYNRHSSNSDYVMELIFNPELGDLLDHNFMDRGSGGNFNTMDSVSWSQDKRTVSWYDQGGATEQANTSGFTYHYIVLM